MRLFANSRSIQAIFTAFLLLGCAVPGLAAPPKVNHLFPAGGQQGKSVVVTVAGDFSSWPVQVWSDHPGVSAAAEADKGKLLLQIAPDAQPGIAWLRLHTAEGASSLQPFVVGTLEESEEKEPNDAPSNPQKASSRSVINGRLQKGGDVDGYRVELKQGETLIAALQAHTVLGSPVDSVLQICQLVERRSLADVPPVVEAYTLQHEHDSVGLDPRLVFTAPRDGSYLLRVFGFPSEPNSNIAFAGGDTYIYRLTLTTGPYLAGVLPMAVPATQAAEVRLIGWNLPADALRTAISGPGSDRPATGLAATAFHPQAAGFIPLRRSELPVVVAADNNDPQHPQPVSLPITLSGQLANPDAAHSFQIDAQKGQKVRVTVEASSLGFPWDPHVSVTDESGKVLMESDDSKKERDPESVFNPPADGKYRVVLRDLTSKGGLDFIYRATIEPVVADFSLTLATDTFVLTKDKPVELPVTIDRRDGFAEPITIRAIGLPDGIAAQEVVSEPKGDMSKSVKLVLQATGDLAAAESGPIFIEGKWPDGKTRVATFNIAKPLAPSHAAAWLGISR